MARYMFCIAVVTSIVCLGTVGIFAAPTDSLYLNVQKELEELQEEESETVQKVRIEQGDTLHEIAKKFGTDVETIAQANNITNPNLIQVGDTLRIPEAKGIFHRVRGGESLDSISETYGTPVGSIIAMNPFIGKDVKEGQEVFIREPKRIPSKNSGLQLASRNAATPQKTSGRTQGMRYLGLFTLTAYTAGPESTGKSPGHPAYGITASGAVVQSGVTIAADPRVIPMGSKVYIENIGIRTVQDTGGAIKGNRIDVYIPDLNQARQFGVKKGVKVYLVD